MRGLLVKTIMVMLAAAASTAVAAGVWNVGRLATLSLAQCLAAGGQYGYSVTYLRGPGGSSSYANDINELGQVALTAVGSSGNAHAFLYDQARGMVDLGTLGGPTSSAMGLNDLGQVVGTASTASGEGRGFVWDAIHGMQDPSRLPSEAIAIDNLGLVLGTAFDHAYVFNRFGYIDLGRVAVSDINDRGQIAGSTSGQAFIYSGGGINLLGKPVGWSSTTAYGINESGEIVGSGWIPAPPGVPYVSGTNGAFLYSAGAMSSIGNLGGGWSEAYDINDVGLVVGRSTTDGAHTPDSPYGGPLHGFLYEGGTMWDLNDLLVPTSADWIITDAQAINNQGWIAGQGYNAATGQRGAVLLTVVPVPEPTTMALLGLGLSCLYLRRAVKRD